MKNQRNIIPNYIAGFVAVALMLPAAANAQAVNTTNNSQLIAVLTALVQVLEQEIEALQTHTATNMVSTLSTPPQIVQGIGSIAGMPAIMPQQAQIVTVAQPTPAPQFTQEPICGFIKGDSNRNTSQGITCSWNTDIPATATLYGSGEMYTFNANNTENYKSDVRVQVLQQWNTPATSFTFTFQPEPASFFAVVVSANGHDTIYKGDDHRQMLPHYSGE